MKKHKKKLAEKTATTINEAQQTELGRGKVNHNFLAALVTSKAYKMQVVKAKKGKGSFKRKAKHTAKNQGRESYLIAA